MSDQVGLWNKIICALFTMPVGILLGLILCWVLSYIFPLKGVGVYIIAALLGVILTTLLSFMFPSIAAKIATQWVKL